MICVIDSILCNELIANRQRKVRKDPNPRTEVVAIMPARFLINKILLMSSGPSHDSNEIYELNDMTQNGYWIYSHVCYMNPDMIRLLDYTSNMTTTYTLTQSSSQH